MNHGRRQRVTVFTQARVGVQKKYGKNLSVLYSFYINPHPNVNIKKRYLRKKKI